MGRNGAMKPKVERVPAPGDLSEQAKALWGAVMPSRVKAPERVALLEQALRAYDRANGAGRGIAAAGLTTTTKTTGAVHIHPLVKVERESRALFAKLWAQLGLDRERWRGEEGWAGD